MDFTDMSNKTDKVWRTFWYGMGGLGLAMLFYGFFVYEAKSQEVSTCSVSLDDNIEEGEDILKGKILFNLDRKDIQYLVSQGIMPPNPPQDLKGALIWEIPTPDGKRHHAVAVYDVAEEEVEKVREAMESGT